jgi:hypothetical protein
MAELEIVALRAATALGSPQRLTSIRHHARKGLLTPALIP